MNIPTISRRIYPYQKCEEMIKSGINPVIAKLYASRGIKGIEDIDFSLTNAAKINDLKNAKSLGRILADAIQNDLHVVVSCDFDVDGCTAGAIVLRAMRKMGMKHIDFAMPQRARHGYGLSPLLVDEIKAKYAPNIIMTVDCGISSFDGVARANELGIKVLVTDHHLPSETLPNAECIVNPNQPGCSFPSKNLSGAGVAFYVMLAVRAELIKCGKYQNGSEIQLGYLLDLVALSTIADVVKLDRNNRILVSAGLQRIRNGGACAGIAALLKVANKDPSKISTFDMGFIIGPRLNAAGRMDDMSVGMKCLLTDDPIIALQIANQLDNTNKSRRAIESEMKKTALIQTDEIKVENRFSLVLFDLSYHQGVIGIVASRIREQFNRPTLVFAKGDDGKIKGSGRSVEKMNLRDALDIIDHRNPGLLLSFGGHAMAAGMMCLESRFNELSDAFESVCSELLTEDDLTEVIETDGDIKNADLKTQLVRAIESDVWGQGFPAPIFDSDFVVKSQSILKNAHLKLKLEKEGVEFDAIWFFHDELLQSEHIHAVYTPNINEWKGKESIQLILNHAEWIVVS